MPKYIALLRGINVSGRNKIIMSDLRALFEELGFSEVTTFIQSGNVIFYSDDPDTKRLEQQIEIGIEKIYGFLVPVIVITKSKIEKILAENPFKPEPEGDDSKIYYVFLKDVPKKEAKESLEGLKFENERFFISNDFIYLKCLIGMGNAKLNNNLFEQKLSVKATTRNHKTTKKLMELLLT
jgi:uncharacterized protein (DUF1697 family)